MEKTSTHSKVFMAICQAGCLVLMLFLLSPVATLAADAMGLPECPKEEGQTESYAVKYRDAALAAYAQASEARDEAYKESIREDVTNPKKNIRGEIGTSYCIDKILLYFDIIRGLLAGASWIEGIIATLISTVFNAVCEYAVAAITTVVNNVLDSICIPIPSLSFSIDLPSIDRKSCDGLSLSDVMGVGVTRASSLSTLVPDNFLSAPMTRWIEDSNLSDLEASIGISGPRF